MTSVFVFFDLCDMKSTWVVLTVLTRVCIRDHRECHQPSAARNRTILITVPYIKWCCNQSSWRSCWIEEVPQPLQVLLTSYNSQFKRRGTMESLRERYPPRRAPHNSWTVVLSPLQIPMLVVGTNSNWHLFVTLWKTLNATAYHGADIEVTLLKWLLLSQT